MMGLSYESEPIMERLKEEYGTQIEFRYVMASAIYMKSNPLQKSSTLSQKAIFPPLFQRLQRSLQVR